MEWLNDLLSKFVTSSNSSQQNTKSTIDMRYIYDITDCETSAEVQMFKLASSIFENSNYTFYMDRSVVESKTFEMFNKVSIGLFNLQSDLYDNVDCIVSMFHERRHCDQFSTNFENDPDMKYGFLAKQNNPEWYACHYPYFTYEVDAVYYGIKDTYDLLCEEYGSDSAEQYILQYIDKCVADNDSKYTGLKYSSEARLQNCKSIQDVFNRFEQRLAESKQIALSFDKTADIKLIQNNDYYNNAIMMYLPDGLEQCKGVAAYNLDKDSNLCKYCNDTELQELDLSRYTLIFKAHYYLKATCDRRYIGPDNKERWRKELCSKSKSELKEFLGVTDVDVEFDEKNL